MSVRAEAAKKLPVYVPHRDDRFEYTYEALEHLEHWYCSSCKFSTFEDEYYECHKIGFDVGDILFDEEVKEIRDDGVFLHCTEYEMS